MERRPLQMIEGATAVVEGTAGRQTSGEVKVQCLVAAFLVAQQREQRHDPFVPLAGVLRRWRDQRTLVLQVGSERFHDRGQFGGVFRLREVVAGLQKVLAHAGNDYDPLGRKVSAVVLPRRLMSQDVGCTVLGQLTPDDFRRQFLHAKPFRSRLQQMPLDQRPLTGEPSADIGQQRLDRFVVDRLTMNAQSAKELRRLVRQPPHDLGDNPLMQSGQQPRIDFALARLPHVGSQPNQVVQCRGLQCRCHHLQGARVALHPLHDIAAPLYGHRVRLGSQCSDQQRHTTVVGLQPRQRPPFDPLQRGTVAGMTICQRQQSRCSVARELSKQLDEESVRFPLVVQTSLPLIQNDQRLAQQFGHGKRLDAVDLFARLQTLLQPTASQPAQFARKLQQEIDRAAPRRLGQFNNRHFSSKPVPQRIS